MTSRDRRGPGSDLEHVTPKPVRLPKPISEGALRISRECEVEDRFDAARRRFGAPSRSVGAIEPEVAQARLSVTGLHAVLGRLHEEPA
jgi:hypothetical protein